MTTMMPPENSNSSAEETAQAMDAWEMRVQQEAREFTYPPTPDLAGGVRQALTHKPVRRLPAMARLAAALVLVMLLALVGVPQLRAAVLEMLRVGAVRIFFVEPTSTELPTATLGTLVEQTPRPTATPVASGTPDAAISPDSSPTRTPRPTFTPTATPLSSILDLSGATTLDDARERVSFDVVLPAYPEDVGLPDKVFLQDENGNSVVVLVWLKAPELVTPTGADSAVWFSLWILDEDAFFGKFSATSEVTTHVNGRRAVWLMEVDRMYALSDDLENPRFERFVTGNVLIWEGENVTYRLETELELDQARKIAESLE